MATDRSPSDTRDGEWVVVETRRVWLRRLGVALLLLAIGAGLLYWKRAALRHYANDWSAQRHLEHAERELADGNHRVALSRALTAIELDPRGLDPLRILCSAAHELGDSRLFHFATALAGHPEATDEDRLAALAVFAEIRDARRFSAFFEALPPEVQTRPEARLQRLRHRLRLGQGAGVVAALEIDPEMAEVWPGPLLRLEGLWQRNHPGDDEAAAALAVELLEAELASEDRAVILEGLSRLTPSRIPPASAGQLLSTLGETFAPAEPPTLRDTLRLAAEPGRRDALVTEATERHRDGSLEALCRWLAGLGEIDAILELTEDNLRALAAPGLFEARVRALIDREEYEEALALLRYPPIDGDAVVMGELGAAAARALGRRSDEVAAWNKARVAAEQDQTRNRHLGLAAAALRAGEEDVAAEAYVAAFRHPLGLMPPAREVAWLLKYLTENDRPEDLLAVTGRLLQWEADEPALVNNAVYLSLILGQPVGEAGVRIMEQIVERHPEIAGFRNTLALARLETGDAAGALALYSKLEDGSAEHGKVGDSFSSAGRAIYSLVQAENGDVQEFHAVAGTIRWEEMLEQERLFFEECFQPHRAPRDKESD